MNHYDKCVHQNYQDPDGNPYGGEVKGVGLSIDWQKGPLGRSEDGTRIEPNGAFVETVIAAAIDRIAFYQNSKFNCRENAIALTHLETALLWLNKRTQDRESRKVETARKMQLIPTEEQLARMVDEEMNEKNLKIEYGV